MNEFAVTAIAHAGFFRAVPQIAAGRGGDGERSLRRIGVLAAVVVPVAERPGFFHEIGRIGAHRPFMAVGADFGIHIEVVQEHKFARELMMVRRDAFGEETQTGSAVALWQVAQHLIVGPVLLDDVNAIFDRAGFARRSRDGIVRCDRRR